MKKRFPGETLNCCWLPLLGSFLLVTFSLGEGQTSNSGAQAASSAVSAAPESILVTGTFAPAPATEIDRSVSVIDLSQQELLYKNWVDSLALVPSIDLRQRAPDDIQADLAIRGSSFGQTLVLVDGLRMDDVQTSHHDMDVPLPSHSLARIEVLRGAGSTLYGSDAMAGSANLITRSAERTDLRVGTGVGNFGINQQSGSASLVGAKFATQLDGERDFSSGFRPDRDYRSLTVLSHSSLDTAWGHTLLLLAYGNKPYGADQFYGPFPSWERTKSWMAGLKQSLGSETELAFGFRRHTDEFVLFRHDPSIYENNHIDESWQFDLRRHQSIGRNSTLFYGGQGIHESITSNNLGDHDRSRGAVYVDYDVRALKRFSFSASAREEVISPAHGEFNPTLAAGVWLASRLKLKG
ncbi:MAG: TonB-dependent receptor plug domain-containing protein, partial [Acidobacteria bacterium]|nr:TonB-dependent receptor plug domain-containing protein [Acidobacteriota bacterium]